MLSSRRSLLTAFFAIALTFLVFYSSSARSRSLSEIAQHILPSSGAQGPPHGHGDPVAQDLACRIWPDWTPPSPIYKDVDATIRVRVGDASVLGQSKQCISPDARFNPYLSTTSRNWTELQWGKLQQRCAQQTYGAQATYEADIRDIWHQPPQPTDLREGAEDDYPRPNPERRTAIVLRTWDNYEYSDVRRTWLRALIAETALHSKGEFEVIMLVNVKDKEVHLEEDEATYSRLLEQCVPSEFRDMALLYNERTLQKWYPKVAEHGAQDQMYQALQIFSQKFPEFDYIWQLEMDLRITSQVYDTLISAANFAQDQPRRNLWERNARFYIPELYDHSYQKFVDSVDAEIGTTGIWGPVHATDVVPKGPPVPSRLDTMWGVGESPDLISLMPMIDPIGTNWVYENGVHGFADGKSTPRRASIVSMTRSSRFLLQLVHEAQQRHGQWLVSEATLETFALIHGLKAVTVPHLIAFANDLSPYDLDKTVNRGPKYSKAGGENPAFSYTTHGYVAGPWGQASYWFAGDDAPNVWLAYLNGGCLPPMLLHPVKDV